MQADRREQQCDPAKSERQNIGARRGLSDRSTRADIVNTSVIRRSGSISASACSSAAVIAAVSPPLRITHPMQRVGACA